MQNGLIVIIGTYMMKKIIFPAIFCFVLFLFFGDYHVPQKEFFSKGEITVRSPHSAGYFDSRFVSPSESDGETIRQWLLTLKKTEEKHLENLPPDLYISYGKEQLGAKVYYNIDGILMISVYPSSNEPILQSFDAESSDLELTQEVIEILEKY